MTKWFPVVAFGVRCCIKTEKKISLGIGTISLSHRFQTAMGTRFLFSPFDVKPLVLMHEIDIHF